jgi:hypothetical protein
MRERVRQQDQRDRPQSGDGIPESGNLGAIGEAAARLLAAGDAAINRAISSDSDAFLRANRQQGGQ